VKVVRVRRKLVARQHQVVDDIRTRFWERVKFI
jgi:hypothetical protein